ncbi:MAG: YfhO family protein [Candidatus Omnitrophica bacterium]|nr:YfhO family protein [Candidatus Omnitrophota bacterium]
MSSKAIDYIKQRYIPIITFAAAMILFLGSVIILKEGFIHGDYKAQFYPWSKIYSISIKNFNLPFWCRYFQSGFPLMAEGQVGGLYPLNMAVFLLLPFKLAYNYIVVLHFMLGWLFTYLYAKKIGAERWGATLAALLFCFGSAYAGCFYNIVTLKTLVWFGLVLLLIEEFFRHKTAEYIIAAAAITGMQFLAGFMQMAAYSLLFYLMYLTYGFRLNKIKFKRRFIYLSVFVAVSLLIALPQVVMTYRLAALSGRSSVSLGFALWRSFPPPFLLTAVFPRWLGFFGAQFYIGILSILFLIYALMHAKSSPKIRPLILIGCVAILAAFGKYNPLYVALLKMTQFYSFRNPSKLLFFGLFAASVLSGFGFSQFFRDQGARRIKLAAKIFSGILAASLSIFIASKFILYTFKDRIIILLQGYAQRHIYGKPYHRYDLDTYMESVRGFYSLLLDGMDLKNIFVMASLVMVIIGLILGIYLIRKRNTPLLRGAVFCIIFIDIFIYGFHGTGFKGNIEPLKDLEPTHQEILGELKSDKELFRILPFDLRDRLPNWARPNANITVGIDSIGAYTPLAEAGYKKALFSLEVVDDALGLVSPDDKSLSDKYQLLRLLNCKYLVTARELKHRFLRKIISEDGIHLYRLTGHLPRIFFAYDLEGNIRESRTERLEIVEYTDGLAKIEISVEREGFLVLSENYYPGWKASIDGQSVEIIEVRGLVQAVKIGKGKHKVTFQFS